MLNNFLFYFLYNKVLERNVYFLNKCGCHLNYYVVLSGIGLFMNQTSAERNACFFQYSLSKSLKTSILKIMRNSKVGRFKVSTEDFSIFFPKQKHK